MCGIWHSHSHGSVNIIPNMDAKLLHFVPFWILDTHVAARPHIYMLYDQWPIGLLALQSHARWWRGDIVLFQGMKLQRNQ